MTGSTIQYYTRKIANSNPTEVIAVVYEITENYLDEAVLAYKASDYETYKLGINKASKCVSDLIEALDLQYEISKALLDIYLFINRELALSIVKKDLVTVERIKAMITKLKKTFEELANIDDSSKMMGNTQEVYAGLTYGKSSLTESVKVQENRGFTV